MDIIYQKLFEIRKYPELYLRKKSLWNLQLFISGYLMRQREIQPDYYQYGSDALDWERILFFVIEDDVKAFDVLNGTNSYCWGV